MHFDSDAIMTNKLLFGRSELFTHSYRPAQVLYVGRFQHFHNDNAIRPVRDFSMPWRAWSNSAD